MRGVEMKNNEKKWLKIVLMILMIAVVIVIFVIGDSQFSSKDDTKSSGPENESSVATINSDVSNTDSSNDKDVSADLVYRTYENENFYLQLDTNGKYIFLSKDNQSYFTGSFTKVNGDNIYKEISRINLLKYGLNYKKINSNNLFYIRAYYSEHVYGENNEYFYDNIHDDAEDYFEFLIYFRESEKNKFIVAARQINADNNFNINEGYF